MYNKYGIENYHLAGAFQLSQHEDCEIRENLTKERQTVQRAIIEMVSKPLAVFCFLQRTKSFYFAKMYNARALPINPYLISV